MTPGHRAPARPVPDKPSAPGATPGTGGHGPERGAAMNPGTAFTRLASALAGGDRDTAREQAGRLAGWVRSGGRLPCDMACLLADCQGTEGSEPRDDW